MTTEDTCPRCGNHDEPIETVVELDDFDATLCQLQCTTCGHYVIGTSEDVTT